MFPSNRKIPDSLEEQAIGTSRTIVSKAQQSHEHRFPIRPHKCCVRRVVNHVCEHNQYQSSAASEAQTHGNLDRVMVFVSPLRNSSEQFQKVARHDHDTMQGQQYQWGERSAENKLSELSIRNGLHEKHNGPSPEASSGRHALWGHFRRRDAILDISSACETIAGGRAQSSSHPLQLSIKPPPRVALTDTKREAWLQDLANPLIPLKRLIRTIPHGIRDRIILDHCLQKKIPILRAIWLIKCIGANELRAFRRKVPGIATASETDLKWLKDWTHSVEIFTENMLGESTALEWMERVKYTLQLVQQLVLHDLLDADEILKWVRRLLWQYSSQPLAGKLLLLRALMPYIWRYRSWASKFYNVVRSWLQKGRHSAFQDKVELEIIAILNHASMLEPSAPFHASQINVKAHCNRTARSYLPVRTIISNTEIEQHYSPHSTFTTNSANVDLHGISFEIFAMLEQSLLRGEIPKNGILHGQKPRNTTSLFTHALGWAARVDKYQEERGQIFVELLKSRCMHDFDTQAQIHTLLGQEASITDAVRDNLCRIVCRITFAGLFSVGNYLQWLLAQGIERKATTSSIVILNAQLLTMLPDSRLVVQTRNLRNNILRKMGIKEVDTLSVLARTTRLVSVQFPDHFYTAEHPGSEIIGLEVLPKIIQSKIARWLYEVLESKTPVIHAWLTNEERYCLPKVKNCNRQLISEKDFCVVSTMFKSLGEPKYLDHIIEKIAETASHSMLLLLSDEVNSICEFSLENDRAFNISRHIFGRFEKLSHHHQLNGFLTASLSDLRTTLNGNQTGRNVHRIQKYDVEFDEMNSLMKIIPEFMRTKLASIGLPRQLLVKISFPLHIEECSEDYTLLISTILDLIKESSHDSFVASALLSLMSHIRFSSTELYTTAITKYISKSITSGQLPSVTNILFPMMSACNLDVSHLLQVSITVLSAMAAETDKMTIAYQLITIFHADLSQNHRTQHVRLYRCTQQVERVYQSHGHLILQLIALLTQIAVREQDLTQGVIRNGDSRNINIMLERVFARLPKESLCLEELVICTPSVLNLGEVEHLPIKASGVCESATSKLTKVLSSIDDFNYESSRFKIFQLFISELRGADIADCLSAIFLKAPEKHPLARIHLWAQLVTISFSSQRQMILEKLSRGLFDYAKNYLQREQCCDSGERLLLLAQALTSVEGTIESLKLRESLLLFCTLIGRLKVATLSEARYLTSNVLQVVLWCIVHGIRGFMRGHESLVVDDDLNKLLDQCVIGSTAIIRPYQFDFLIDLRTMCCQGYIPKGAIRELATNVIYHCLTPWELSSSNLQLCLEQFTSLLPRSGF